MTRVGNSRTSSMSSAPLTSAEEARLQNELENLAPNVLSAVVRLNPSKRLDLLILAAKLLNAQGIPTTVLLAGDGPERESLEAQAEHEGVDVRFLGALYSESAIERIYSLTDVAVLPSAAGLSVMQSLEHGTPVITDDSLYTQMPEADAVVEGVTGSRYRKNDADDLARAIREWLEGRARSERVKHACLEEIRRNWSPTEQSASISREVLSLILRSNNVAPTAD